MTDLKGFLRNYGVLILLALMLVVVTIAYRERLAIRLDLKTVLVLVSATVLVYLADRRFLLRNLPAGDDGTRYVVAFDAFVFVLAGLVAAVLACQEWQTASLLGGASLLMGGFLGLLFGYPQGVASQTEAQANRPSTNTNPGGTTAAQATTGNPNATTGTGATPHAAGTGGAPVPQSGSVPAATATKGTGGAGGGGNNAPNLRSKNLVAESAATLGKVIAGFSLAKAGSALNFFDYACSAIGPALGVHRPDTANIVAGVIIAYFASTGFLSGLFLPSYFMKDQL